MDPNNQNPQVGDLTKLEEDLQKLNSQVTTPTPPPIATVSTTEPLKTAVVAEPVLPQTPIQEPPVAQIKQETQPPVAHGFPTAIHNTDVTNGTVNPVAQNPAFAQNSNQQADVKPADPVGNPPGKKSNLVLTIAFVLMAVAVLAAVAYAVGNSFKKDKQPSQATNTTSYNVATPQASTESATPVATENSAASPSATTPLPKTIDIKNFAYSPSNLIVKPGETVTVKNSDSVAHSLTEDTNLFDTGLIQPGESKTFIVPSKAGSYKVHCAPHPSITGTIVVEDSGNPS